MASFTLPEVSANAEHWGPSEYPELYKDLPYVPFGKGDKLGKVADWGNYTRQSRFRSSRNKEENTEFQYAVDRQEEKTFKLVDHGKTRSSASGGSWRRGGGGGRGGRGGGRGGRGGGRFGGRVQLRSAAGAGGATYEDMATRKQRKLLATNHNKRVQRLNKARKASRRSNMTRHVHREDTVSVDANWNMVAQFDLSSLSKLETVTPEGKDLKWAGSLRRWNDKMDRLTARTKAKLATYTDRAFYYTTANEDPNLQELAQEDEGNVFATDAVLAHLMTCSRSVYPWDVVVTYLPGGAIFLDVRDALEFSMHTVCETAHTQPEEGPAADELNGAVALAEEATAVNESFSQQVLLPSSAPSTDKPPVSGLEEDPFWDEEEAEEGQTAAAAVAYRYRKFELGDDIQLVARTSINAYGKLGGKPALINAFALTEGDPRVLGNSPYSKTVEKRGTLIATEMTNNSFKMAKFVATAHLSGADSIRLGFVARASAASADKHNVLATQQYKPDSLAHQMSLSTNNMWGVIKWIVMLVRQHAANLRGDEDEEEWMGKFVLVRDGNSALLSLYSVPLDIFDGDDDDEEEDAGEAGAAAAAGSA